MRKLLLLIALVGTPVVAAAAPDLPNDLVVDQQCFAYPQWGMSFWEYAPLGQEFIPEQSSLDVVEMQVSGQQGIHMHVRVHQDTISGPVLGTSLRGATAFFVTPPTYLNFAITRFLFESPVPLVPGNRYVIEIYDEEFATPHDAGATGGNSDPYAPGRMISVGVANDDGWDCWFREGTLAPTPADDPTWGWIKALYATPRRE